MSTIKSIVLDLKRHLSLVHPGRQPTVFTLLLLLASPRYLPVLVYRLSHALYRKNLKPCAWLLARLNQILHGIEIASACPIGPGLFLPHTYGTVVGAASIGDNVTIFQGSTLGAKYLDFSYASCCRPRIGSGVTVGAGSKVLGNVYIGDNATIGANAVVISDLPSNCVAVGIPAKPLQSPNYSNSTPFPV